MGRCAKSWHQVMIRRLSTFRSSRLAAVAAPAGAILLGREHDRQPGHRQGTTVMRIYGEGQRARAADPPWEARLAEETASRQTTDGPSRGHRSRHSGALWPRSVVEPAPRVWPEIDLLARHKRLREAGCYPLCTTCLTASRQAPGYASSRIRTAL